MAQSEYAVCKCCHINGDLHMDARQIHHGQRGDTRALATCALGLTRRAATRQILLVSAGRFCSSSTYPRPPSHHRHHRHLSPTFTVRANDIRTPPPRLPRNFCEFICPVWNIFNAFHVGWFRGVQRRGFRKEDFRYSDRWVLEEGQLPGSGAKGLSSSTDV